MINYMINSMAESMMVDNLINTKSWTCYKADPSSGRPAGSADMPLVASGQKKPRLNLVGRVIRQSPSIPARSPLRNCFCNEI